MKTTKTKILGTVLLLIITASYLILRIGTLDYHKIEASFSNVTSARDLNSRSMRIKYTYKLTWEYLGETHTMWVRKTYDKPKPEVWVNADGSRTSLNNPRSATLTAAGLLCIQVGYLIKLLCDMRTSKHVKHRKKRK